MLHPFMRSYHAICSIAFLLCTLCCRPARQAAAIHKEVLTLDSLPRTMYLIDSAREITKLGANTFALTAAKGTDLHYPASGIFRKRNAPKVLFTPDDNFDFSARLQPQFGNRYDGGALIIYTDTANWAKILFQHTGSGCIVGMSVVENFKTDDSYYIASDTTAIYLRIKKSGRVCSFYTSNNGSNWNLTRQFIYETKKYTGLGFYVQSPVGKECRVVFSNIQYQRL